ncbi:MAG: DUF1634 domain-containing protein [Gemmatimonadales bacterium]
MSGKQLPGHDPMELVIGNVLRWGVALAATVGVFGVVAFLFARGSDAAEFRHFSGDAATGIPAIVTGVLSGSPRALMQLGILLLIVTPIMRVALSLVAFVRERDRTYIAVTALVLLLLLYGLVGGQL